MASEQEIIALYERHCDKIKKVSGGYMALCPFHDDSNPSLSIKSDGQFQCFGCSKKGNAISFAKLMNEDPTPFYSDDYQPIKKGLNGGKSADTVDKTTDNNGKIIIPNEEMSILQEYGYDYNTFMYEYMYEWQDSEWKNLNMVGMFEGHMLFPYFDEDGESVVGIHHHKSAPHWTGDGKNKWYNEWHLQYMDRDKPLIICEGEKDCLKLSDNNFNAITVSGGVGTCPKKNDIHYVPTGFLDFPKLIIHFDNDDAGRKGAKRLADIIYECLGVLPYITKWRKGLPDKFDPSDKDGIKETRIAIEKKVLHKTKVLNKIGAFTFMTGKEMRHSTPKPREWIVENILPKRSNGILAGNTGSKKSYWVMQLGMSIANGEKEFLGNKITKPLKVLYIDTEIGQEELQIRFHNLIKHLDWQLGDENWRAMSKSGITVDAWDDIHQTIEQRFKPDLLIIDSLYNTTTVDDFSKAPNMAKVTNALTEFKDKYGISLLTVGHFNKNGSELGLDINRMSGSSVLQNWIEWCMIMVSTNITNFNLWTVGKTRHTYHDKSIIGIETNDFWFTPKGIIAEPYPYLISKEKKAKWSVVLEDCPDEFTTLEWLNVFNIKHQDKSERTGKLWLSECSKTQMIEKLKHGHYKKKLSLIDDEV